MSFKVLCVSDCEAQGGKIDKLQLSNAKHLFLLPLANELTQNIGLHWAAPHTRLRITENMKRKTKTMSSQWSFIYIN